jgi:hypothetical protein
MVVDTGVNHERTTCTNRTDEIATEACLLRHEADGLDAFLADIPALAGLAVYPHQLEDDGHHP